MLTLFTNATIVTMDKDRKVLHNAALAVSGDKIEWVGGISEIPSAYQAAIRISAQDKVIFPGFVNLHTHAALSILRGLADDKGLSPAYSPKVPQGVYLSPDEIYLFTLLGALEALRFGTTTIVDNYIYSDRTVIALDQLGLRAVVSERLHDADLFQIPKGVYQFDENLGNELLERNIELVKNWQGHSNGRITCCIGTHAPDTCSTPYLEKARDAAEKLGLGMVIHLAQSHREQQEIQKRSGKRVTHYLNDLGLLGPQMIAGHCVFLSEDEMDLLAKSGTHVSHLSGSNAKAGKKAPVNELLSRGMNIGLGSDNMSGDMVEAMRMALIIARLRTDNNQALKAMQVLEMATINGAKALGMEDQIGSLEIGKKADLLMMNILQPHWTPLIDPVANLVHGGLGTDISLVMVDGVILVENGVVKSVDAQAVLRQAQKTAIELWRKMDEMP